MQDGVVVTMRVCPLPIRVTSHQLRAGVTVHHAVDVDHRHYFEDEVFEQLSCGWAIRKQEVKHPFKHKACSCLTRMLPCHYPHRLLTMPAYFRRTHLEKVNLVATDSAAETLDLDTSAVEGKFVGEE